MGNVLAIYTTHIATHSCCYSWILTIHIYICHYGGQCHRLTKYLDILVLFNFLWQDVISGNWKIKKTALLWDVLSSLISWFDNWSGLKWHLLEETWLKVEIERLIEDWWRGLSHLMTSVIWRTSHVTSLDTGCWRTWPDKERCDIWSDKTCDRANATSCSGGRALNWGLMERGLMKRNVTWLAMSLEDSADRSKISTPHSTLERRSQIWWRATLNYLVDEDHLRRWSNQMAASE